jgi:type II secretory pathway pseudopilin PulG
MFKLVKLIKNNQQPTNSEAGYTILEAIIAILIVTVLMSVVAPVIGFSVGTRVSAKRIELASQAARSYLDWVKADTCTTGTVSLTNCGRSPEKTTTTIENATEPSITSLNTACTAGKYCDTTSGINGRLFCVDGDGDGECKKDSLKDMIVQGVSRNTTWGSTPDYTRGYQLGVRVYRADAFSGTELKKVTTSTGVNTMGGDRRYPLVMLTTEIAPTENSFDNTNKRLCEEVTPRPASCPSP